MGMDDLEENPLYKAFLTKFKREFEIACKASYLIAIPHSDQLAGLEINQSLANSHILMPSKLLKFHYTPLQAGLSDYIELEPIKRQLIVHKPKVKASGNLNNLSPVPDCIIVNILGEEISYNCFNREFKIIVIDRALHVFVGGFEREQQQRLPNHGKLISNSSSNIFKTILAPLIAGDSLPFNELSYGNHSSKGTADLSPTSSYDSGYSFQMRRIKPQPASLVDHEHCFQYLAYISQKLTLDLEEAAKNFHSRYMILSDYLDDAANRVKNLIESFIHKYQVKISNRRDFELGRGEESIKKSVRISVENYVVHLLHEKLISAISKKYFREDRILSENFNQINRNKQLTICQLGARKEFSNFVLNDGIILELGRLSNLTNPLEMVNSLINSFKLINEALELSVRLNKVSSSRKYLDNFLDESFYDFYDNRGPNKREKISICCDDLIASFIFSIAHAQPARLYSVSRYLELFGWSSTEKDQAAYYTATFQLVIQYIFNYKTLMTTTTTTPIEGGEEKPDVVRDWSNMAHVC